MNQLTNHQVILDQHPTLLEPMPVLDRGFVRLVDWVGSDQRVVDAARTSYGAGTKTLREDRGLINYLVRMGHTSPLEQVSLTFHIKLPLFVFAQKVRHRTAKLNSLSGRYSVMPDEFYIPSEWRGQDEVNKQGSSGTLNANLSESFEASCREAYAKYEALLTEGVSREMARMILPQNIYTQIFWTIDLHNCMHYLRLRQDSHAQMEIRVYADAIAECAKAVAPMCYEAYEEHVRDGRRFSRSEVSVINKLIAGEENPIKGKYLEEFNYKLQAIATKDN